MIDVVIQGICGRMGKTLVAMLGERGDCRVVAGVDRFDDGTAGCPVFDTIDKLDSLEQKPDVLIDFSLPEAVPPMLAYCAARGLPCVVCTTGLDDGIKAQIRDAGCKTAVFYSANMSIGVNLLAKLARRAAAALPSFDIEIIEKHHHNKLDAPSGTALMLAEEINNELDGRLEYVYDRHNRRQKRGANELGLHAVRGGSIVGEHEVLFAGPDEVITLAHSAGSRSVFANGAVIAALFLHDKAPGLYSMNDVLEDV